MESILTKSQKKTYGPKRLKNGDVIIVEVRYDDQCGNGHNSFAITADIYSKDRYPGESTIEYNGKKLWCYTGGCCHEQVAEAFPELAPFIKWHLSSSDGPMHYVANGVYWAGYYESYDKTHTVPANLEHLKSTIAYGTLPDDEKFDLVDVCHSDARGWTWNEANKQKLTEWLKSRTDALLEAFRADVIKLGFTW